MKGSFRLFEQGWPNQGKQDRALQDNPAGTRTLSAMAGQCCPTNMALTVYSSQPPISLFCFSVPLPRG